MRRLLLALLSLLSGLVLNVAPARAEKVDDAQFRRFIYFATLEGLYETGLPDEVVDRILSIDPKLNLPISFLKGCPVCQPVHDAFAFYRLRPRMWGSERDFASSISPQRLAALSDSDDLKRTAAIGELVSQIISQRVATMRWTSDERIAWNKAFERAAEEGEKQLRLLQAQGGPAAWQMMWSCLVCDGAKKGGCQKQKQ